MLESPHASLPLGEIPLPLTWFCYCFHKMPVHDSLSHCLCQERPDLCNWTQCLSFIELL